MLAMKLAARGVIAYTHPYDLLRRHHILTNRTLLQRHHVTMSSLQRNESYYDVEMSFISYTMTVTLARKS